MNAKPLYTQLGTYRDGTVESWHWVINPARIKIYHDRITINGKYFYPFGNFYREFLKEDIVSIEKFSMVLLKGIQINLRKNKKFKKPCVLFTGFPYAKLLEEIKKAGYKVK